MAAQFLRLRQHQSDGKRSPLQKFLPGPNPFHPQALPGALRINNRNGLVSNANTQPANRFFLANSRSQLEPPPVLWVRLYVPSHGYDACRDSPFLCGYVLVSSVSSRAVAVFRGEPPMFCVLHFALRVCDCLSNPPTEESLRGRKTASNRSRTKSITV